MFINKYSATGADLAQIMDAIYKLGHFYDTGRVLTAAGVTNTNNPPAYFEPNVVVKLSDECMLHFRSMPPGTHCLSVMYEAARRLLGSKLAVYVPQLFQFTSLVPKRDEVLVDPANFHVDAHYLTGGDHADYNDLDNAAVMGSLGSYIRIFMSASTLSKSPYFSQEKFESYPDYNADWHAFLTRVRAASTHATQAGLEALNQLETAVGPGTFKTLVECFNLTISPGQAALLTATDDDEEEMLMMMSPSPIWQKHLQLRVGSQLRRGQPPLQL